MAGILNKIKEGVQNIGTGIAYGLDLPIWTKNKVAPKDYGPSKIKQQVGMQTNVEIMPGLFGDKVVHRDQGRAFPQVQPVFREQTENYPNLQGSFNRSSAFPIIQRTQPSVNLMNRSSTKQPLAMQREHIYIPNIKNPLPMPNRSVLDYLDQI